MFITKIVIGSVILVGAGALFSIGMRIGDCVVDNYGEKIVDCTKKGVDSVVHTFEGVFKDTPEVVQPKAV